MPDTFTNAEKAKCARREVNLRRRAYPRWIQKGTITQTAADREIRMMEEIAAYFEGRAADEAREARPTLL